MNAKQLKEQEAEEFFERERQNTVSRPPRDKWKKRGTEKISGNISC